MECAGFDHRGNQPAVAGAPEGRRELGRLLKGGCGNCHSPTVPPLCTEERTQQRPCTSKLGFLALRLVAENRFVQ